MMHCVVSPPLPPPPTPPRLHTNPAPSSVCRSVLRESRAPSLTRSLTKVNQWDSNSHSHFTVDRLTAKTLVGGLGGGGGE